TVTIRHEASTAQQVTSTAHVADAQLSASGTKVTPTAGAPFSGMVASFTDADPGGKTGDYIAMIDWGDGNTSPGSIATNGTGGFAVSGSNAYAAAGAYTIHVTITDTDGNPPGPANSTAIATSTASVSSSGTSVKKGQAAGPGFWGNTNGQTLIRA